MISIYVSVICYENEEEVFSFAQEIKHQTLYNSILFIITYNKITSLEKKKWLETRLDEENVNYLSCVPPKNIGYLHGSLYGLSKCSINKDSWCVICNTDLKFDSIHFFEYLLQNINEENIWGLAPKIYLKSSNKMQNPFMEKRPKKKEMRFRKIMFSNYFLYRVYLKLAYIKRKGRKKKEITTEDYSRKIYAMHGCFMCLKDEVISILQERNDSIFMFGEELLVAELIRNNGKTIQYMPNALLYHLQKGVSNYTGNKRKQKWFKQSIGYIYNIFFAKE